MTLFCKERQLLLEKTSLYQGSTVLKLQQIFLSSPKRTKNKLKVSIISFDQKCKNKNVNLLLTLEKLYIYQEFQSQENHHQYYTGYQETVETCTEQKYLPHSCSSPTARFQPVRSKEIKKGGKKRRKRERKEEVKSNGL